VDYWNGLRNSSIRKNQHARAEKGEKIACAAPGFSFYYKGDFDNNTYSEILLFSTFA
jgi:cobyrinic acid a,c-diamide synthase